LKREARLVGSAWVAAIAGAAALLLVLGACGVAPPDDSPDGTAPGNAGTAEVADVVDPACVLPPDAVTHTDQDGLVLKVWTFPLEEVHSRSVLPDDAGLLAWRTAIRTDGAVEKQPALSLPPARDDNEARIWANESFNNDLAYRGEAGSIEPVTCLDALLFAEQNARIPQLRSPTEFLASVLRRERPGGEEVAVVFGAGSEMFPPRSVHGIEIVDEHVADGWRFWYMLHNHTRQSSGALGVPVPSTSDVQFVRRLAQVRGLERVRVTNGFYTFDAAIDEIQGFRSP
jgi:hypothetical protein